MNDSVTDRVNLLMKNIYLKFRDSVDRFPKLFWSLFIAVFFVAIFYLNILTPLISDDFAYKFVYGEDRLVTSIKDAFDSQVNHYYLWGGRSVVHFIAQLLLLIPPIMADLLNALMFMSYTVLVYYHIKGRGQHSLALFILISLAAWFFQPVLGDTVFWITGAANYLWGTVLILLFLLPYRLYRGFKSSSVFRIIGALGMFLLGILSGWTNENTAVAMLVVVVFFCLYYRYQKWNIPTWAITGLVGALIGYSLMILAPGNYLRAGETPFSLFLFVYRLFNCTEMIFVYCNTLLLVTLLLFVVNYFYTKDDSRKTLIHSLIYIVAAIIAVYVMVLSPSFPRRALFGVVTFLIIGAGVLVYNLDNKQAFIRNLRSVVVLFGCVNFLFSYYFAYNEITSFQKIAEQRKLEIEKAIDQQNSTLEFERFDGGVYIHGEDPFSAVLMSRYYGVDIKLVAPRN